MQNQDIWELEGERVQHMKPKMGNITKLYMKIIFFDLYYSCLCECLNVDANSCDIGALLDLYFLFFNIIGF